LMPFITANTVAVRTVRTMARRLAEAPEGLR